MLTQIFALNRKHLPYAKIAPLLLLASLLIMGLGRASIHAQTPVCVQEVVVQPGESLATIAVRFFGTQDRYEEIIAATNAQAADDASYTTIDDPDAVEAGWKLCIPSETIRSTPSKSQQATPRQTATPQVGAIKATIAARESPRSRNFLGQSSISLEENTQLFASMLAERMGEDGIHPLSIEYLRRQEYPGSPLTVVETLPAASNYRQYRVSYLSEGLELYAVMTVPIGEKPENGWPVVIFVHGYIAPAIYNPTERYVDYVDAIASAGYIVLRPDLRGHADSRGEAYGAYGDPGYTIDVLNAVASIQQYPDADPNRIGLWGHSMGGYIIARVMVVSGDVKAGVIWAGVVAPYEELQARWHRPKGGRLSALAEGELPIPMLVNAHGTPDENPDFWASISANSYVRDLSGPVQLHHGTADATVPLPFSDLYYKDMIAAGQVAEYYVYSGDDHNLSTGFEIAMRRTLAFFDRHVKDADPATADAET